MITAELERPIPWVASVARLEGRPLIAVPLAITLVALALIVRLAIQPYLPPGYPFITFFPAVVMASYLCGWRIGTMSAILSGLAAWYFFIPPARSFGTDEGTLIAMGFYVFVTVTDIVLIWALESAARQSRTAEKVARDLAKSRELLFHELQHRVSNNLQFVSALVGLEARRVDDVVARKALKDVAERMALVGRIQRALHDPNRQETSFQAMAHDLLTDALSVAGASQITFTIDGDGTFGPDQAPPLALILLETVNNAVEHAFADSTAGHLTISLAHHGDQQTVMTVRDNGAGLKDALAANNSLGLRLVKQLAQQLGGRYDLAPVETGGAVATLTFRSAV